MLHTCLLLLAGTTSAILRAGLVELPIEVEVVLHAEREVEALGGDAEVIVVAWDKPHVSVTSG